MTPDAHAAQNEIAKHISLTAYKGTVVIACDRGDSRISKIAKALIDT
jgi:hypothetical protein